MNTHSCESCGATYEKGKGRGYNNRTFCDRCLSTEEKWTFRNRNKFLKRKYNLTLLEYKNLFDSQGGTCRCCKTKLDITAVQVPKKGKRSGAEPVVDHCHQTGVVRGILCFSCNVALGHVKDDIKVLQSMVQYLKETEGVKLDLLHPKQR